MKEKQAYRILVVDDESECFELMKDIIHEIYPDATVLYAANGLRAIEILRVNIVHVIISDFSMPELNGLELLILLGAANVMSPFVLVSGCIEPKVSDAALRGGAVAILEKPYSHSSVKTVIEKAIKSSEYNSLRAYGSTIDERLISVELYLPERIVNSAILECDREGISLSDRVSRLLKKAS